MSRRNGLAALVWLIGYELKILKRETVFLSVGSLALISIALIAGSRSSSQYTVWIFFENLVPLTLLFIPTALLSNDRDQRIIERVFSLPTSSVVIYLRRLACVYIMDVVGLFVLALLWQVKTGTPAVPQILITSLPPTLFLSSLSFGGAALLKDANVGAVAGGSWWLMNYIFKSYGNAGWFAYIFLFKQTYYPDSITFWSNRLTLVALAIGLVSLASFLFRRAERYL